MITTELNLQGYPNVRDKIRDGDILFFHRNWRPSNWLITKLGRTASPYCHAGMACWWRERLFLLETVQRGGGRALALSTQVDACPGHWDVYRISSTYRRNWSAAKSVRHMIGLVGERYGWGALIRASLVHLPFVRWMQSPAEEDVPGELPFCSMAVSAALRAGGFDPCPHLTDSFTEPGDLADSPALQYQFTLN